VGPTGQRHRRGGGERAGGGLGWKLGRKAGLQGKKRKRAAAGLLGVLG
jgi:hypothetical protein